MRLVVQRIRRASVSVEGEVVGRAGAGLCLFLGVARDDTREDAEYLAGKAAALRIFPDGAGRFDRSVAQVGGDVLVVSEFTLYGDCAKGNRPSFTKAAPPERARALYEDFIAKLEALGLKVACGKFQSKMEVEVVNDGPVTFLLERS